ncbi:MAG: hypothetical protein KBS79_00130 [Lachnospiraceae bacterium]|nr:hypothetical protein [Candidatus Minthocola equi]
MSKKIFCLCDYDRNYAENFSKYIWDSAGREFEVRAFTRPEIFTDYIISGKVDVLLIAEDFLSELINKVPTLSIQNAAVFILTDNSREADFGSTIYKYQSAKKILEEIMTVYGKSAESPAEYSADKERHIAIYSPLGRCGKTSLALAIGRLLSQYDDTLVISFDEYCAHDEFKWKTSDRGLSELIYRYYVKDKEGILLTEYLREEGGLFTLPGVSVSEDIKESDGSILSEIVTDYYNLHQFKNIVLDVGNAVPHPEMLLRESNQVIVPTLEDEISGAKLSSWQPEPEINRRLHYVNMSQNGSVRDPLEVAEGILRGNANER